MNEVWKLMDHAATLKERDSQQALEGYNDAFNLLIDMAGKYAVEKESAVTTDMQELRSRAEVLFQHSKEYLKRDSTASTILNEMGALFMDMGEYDNAKQKFMESIEYIPDGEDYSEPADNLERLVTLAQPSPEEEILD
jgi:uncharacterized protein HemY